MERVKVPPPIRHVEARRVATCGFANHVASTALSVFRHNIGYQQPTCVAAILAYDGSTLTVLSMGVGTKFLASKHSLRAVRDMHAEVLCRRGLQRFLINEINTDLPSRILRKDGTSGIYHLQPHVTLHLYCSSTPCGNSALKKFATLKKESYREGFNEMWPVEKHEEIDKHSTHLGQCALLLKKNPIGRCESKMNSHRPDPRLELSSKKRSWPLYCNTAWCPPGTTASWDVDRGAIHTCSDKLARWNVLGWQGSLIASKLVEPIRPVSMTVGRKFSSVTCRRAVCCRVQDCPCHVAVMGDAVYMDESGAIDTSLGDEMRFHVRECWVSWRESPFVDHGTDCGHYITESINTDTGMLCANDAESSICTVRLMEDFGIKRVDSITELRELKQTLSPDYENHKDQLLTKDPVFKDWNRRVDLMYDWSCSTNFDASPIPSVTDSV